MQNKNLSKIRTKKDININTKQIDLDGVTTIDHQPKSLLTIAANVLKHCRICAKLRRIFCYRQQAIPQTKSALKLILQISWTQSFRTRNNPRGGKEKGGSRGSWCAGDAGLTSTLRAFADFSVESGNCSQNHFNY